MVKNILIGSMICSIATAYTTGSTCGVPNNSINLLDGANTPSAIETNAAISKYVNTNGTVKSVSENSVLIEGPMGELVLNTNSNTLVFDNGSNKKINILDLKVGDNVSTLHSMMTTRSLPPQSPTDIIVKLDSENSALSTSAAFIEAIELKDNVIITSDTIYNLTDNTEVVDLTGHNLKVVSKGDTVITFQNMMTLSLPAQTTPSKVVILKSNVENSSITNGEFIMKIADSICDNKNLLAPLMDSHIAMSSALYLEDKDIITAEMTTTEFFNKKLTDETKELILSKVESLKSNAETLNITNGEFIMIVADSICDNKNLLAPLMDTHIAMSSSNYLKDKNVITAEMTTDEFFNKKLTTETKELILSKVTDVKFKDAINSKLELLDVNSLKINGTNVDLKDTKIEISNGNVMIPLRLTFETLGFTVTWNQDTYTATITNGTKVASYQIGFDSYNSDNETKSLGVAPKFINGCTYIPLSAIDLLLKDSVSISNKTIIIGYTK